MAETVTVSAKYQVVIPRSVRSKLRVAPGQRFMWIVKGSSMSLVPVPTLDEMQGALKDIKPEGYRDEVDRL